MKSDRRLGELQRSVVMDVNFENVRKLYYHYLRLGETESLIDEYIELERTFSKKVADVWKFFELKQHTEYVIDFTKVFWDLSYCNYQWVHHWSEKIFNRRKLELLEKDFRRPSSLRSHLTYRRDPEIRIYQAKSKNGYTLIHSDEGCAYIFDNSRKINWDGLFIWWKENRKNG